MKKPFVYKSISFIGIILCLFCYAIPSFGQKKGGSGTGTVCPSPSPLPFYTDTSLHTGSGGLDTTFGINGVSPQFTPPPDVSRVGINAVAVQSDGKIVGAGQIFYSTTRWDVFVVRYNTDGTLDYSFGNGNGYINDSAEPGYIVDIAYAVKIQPDGKILVGGYGGSYGRGFVFRYNTDGTRDTSTDMTPETSFGNGGLAAPNFPTGVKELALQADGKILAGGTNNFSAFRLKTDGSVDTTFGTNGFVSVNPSPKSSGSGDAYAMAIQMISGQERIVLGGYMRDSTSGAYKFGLVRLTPTGALDTSFGSGGRVSTGFFGISDNLYSLAIDANNKIIAGGSAATSCTGSDAAVARYNENGSLDTTFSGDGKANTNVYGYTDVTRKVLVQPDGKIVTIGYSRKGDGSSESNISVIRYNPDGSADSGFGPGQAFGFGNGIVTKKIHGSEFGYAGALQPDGKIIVAGTSENGSISLYAGWVARYLP